MRVHDFPALAKEKILLKAAFDEKYGHIIDRGTHMLQHIIRNCLPDSGAAMFQKGFIIVLISGHGDAHNFNKCIENLKIAI